MERGISIDELAQLARKSLSDMYLVEHGARLVKEPVAKLIAERLGCTLDDLINEACVTRKQ